MKKTIFALSTPESVSAIAVIRISGPDTLNALCLLCRCNVTSFKKKRTLSLKKIYSSDNSLLDEALVVSFEENKSFTNEQMAELHIHGSIIVIKTVMETLSKMSFLRQAFPGEFTQRALENNKLNLTQVEGLSDLLQAETEYQQKQALDTYTGKTNKKIIKWKNDVLKILSLIEANIDFYEDVDDTDIIKKVTKSILCLEKDLIKEKKGFKFSESLRSGFIVSIVGKPNSGKSTLINKLAKRNVAITSRISGIRKSKNTIEKIGISNSLKKANKSHLRVILSENIEEVLSLGLKKSSLDIVLRPKGDLKGSEPSISGKTGKGIENLLQQIKEKLYSKKITSTVINRTRHLERVNVCINNINNIKELVSRDIIELELLANELRGIILNIDGLLGLIDTESMLGEIFSNFCIGK